MGSVPGVNASRGPISAGLIDPRSTSVGSVLTRADGPGFTSADPDPVHTPDEIQRMKRELMDLRTAASGATGLPFSAPIHSITTGLIAITEVRADLERADERIDELMRNHEAMKTRLDHAAHAAYRLAALACDVTGADARAVRSAAERCCDKDDESTEPEEPKREYREG